MQVDRPHPRLVITATRRLLLITLIVPLFACTQPPEGQSDADSVHPAQEGPGHPEERLAEEDEVPVTDEDHCGLDAGGLYEERAAGESPYSRERVSFALHFGDEVNPHRLMSTSVMPGETLELEPVLTGRQSRFEVEVDGGRLEQVSAERWTWTAPEEPGFHCLRITDVTKDETMCLNAFVLTPWDGSGTLNGYRIGSYPDELFRGLETYRAPEGFIEVTEGNRGV